MDSNDDVSIDDSNGRNDDIAMVFLALFLPWERLSKYFIESEATDSTISSLCWNILYKCRPTLNAHVQFYDINLLQMRRSRLKAHAATESRTENNCLDTTDVFENEILYDSIEAKDLLRDLGILNNQCLQSIVTETISEWQCSDIRESLAVIVASQMWNAI